MTAVTGWTCAMLAMKEINEPPERSRRERAGYVPGSRAVGSRGGGVPSGALLHELTQAQALAQALALARVPPQALAPSYPTASHTQLETTPKLQRARWPSLQGT